MYLYCYPMSVQERQARREALAEEAGILPPTYEELSWSNGAFVPDDPPAYSEVTKVPTALYISGKLDVRNKVVWSRKFQQ